MNDLNKDILTGLLCDDYTTVPNIEPTAGNYSHPYKNSLLKQHYMIDFRHTNTPLSNETERSRFTTN